MLQQPSAARAATAERCNSRALQQSIQHHALHHGHARRNASNDCSLLRLSVRYVRLYLCLHPRVSSLPPGVGPGRNGAKDLRTHSLPRSFMFGLHPQSRIAVWSVLSSLPRASFFRSMDRRGSKMVHAVPAPMAWSTSSLAAQPSHHHRLLLTATIDTVHRQFLSVRLGRLGRYRHGAARRRIGGHTRQQVSMLKRIVFVSCGWLCRLCTDLFSY